VFSVPPLTTPEGVEAAKAYVPTPGFSWEAQDEERAELAKARERMHEDTGTAGSVVLGAGDLLVGPPESDLESSAMVAGEVGSVVLKPAARFGSRFFDEAGELVGTVTKAGSRSADDAAEETTRLTRFFTQETDEGVRVLRKGRTAGVAGAGALTAEGLSPGSVSGPIEDVFDVGGDAAESITEAGGRGLIGAIADALGGLFRGGVQGLGQNKLGSTLLVVGGLVALLVLTPIGAMVFGGNGS
jgi:hypothetical protein